MRQQARAAAEAEVNVRVKEVAAGGEVLGGNVGRILEGKLAVSVEVSGTVYGKVVGLKADQIGGGETTVDMDIGTVGEGGAVTGLTVDRLG